jgi:2-methylisocitrate lyase-like PEP mutase family enzyme
MTETRNLIESERFAELLKKLKAQLVKLGVTIFINVRSDVFLLGIKNPREEAVLRAKRFQQAGADGLFFPCVTDVEDIRTIVEATELPVNVMAMPDLPSMAVLTELGVKRISMGNIAHDRINQQLTSLIAEIRGKQSFHPLFAQ